VSRPGFGGQTLVEPLRRVLVRSPQTVDLSRWRGDGWLAEPDVALAAKQHEAFRDLLRETGAEVLEATSPAAAGPDAVYPCDPAFMTDAGALILRPGKEGRRDEPRAIAEDLRVHGVAIAAEMDAPATAEGGDLVWLDERTLLAGRSYRTNDAGIAWLRDLLPGVEVHAFDLPNLAGPEACLHLMSLISPLDRDLVVAYVPEMPVRLLELLAARDVAIVEVPDEEFATMGPNVLALAPRVALAVEGNPETRRRMERAGVDVRTYDGSEISLKGEGGPTCLTRDVLRG
jgi:N-dimethylarginine dimethylaminohydrolase